MLGILIMQWIKESEREAKRIDRALDRAEAQERARSAAPAAPVAPTSPEPAASLRPEADGQ
jgi:putative copper resistance protein D